MYHVLIGRTADDEHFMCFNRLTKGVKLVKKSAVIKNFANYENVEIKKDKLHFTHKKGMELGVMNGAPILYYILAKHKVNGKDIAYDVVSQRGIVERIDKALLIHNIEQGWVLNARINETKDGKFIRSIGPAFLTVE